MYIAVIGWGSLIWSPDSLQLASRWRRDGPLLPVEFARISSDGRLTLVIHPTAQSVQTLWAIATATELTDACKNLQDREGTTAARINSATAAGAFSEEVPADVQDAIAQWLALHRTVDACVWTGLPSNWMEKRGKPYSADDAVLYLTGLHDSRRAREYVQNAPAQIESAARRAIRAQFGWTNAILPDNLFDNV